MQTKCLGSAGTLLSRVTSGVSMRGLYIFKSLHLSSSAVKVLQTGLKRNGFVDFSLKNKTLSSLCNSHQRGLIPLTLVLKQNTHYLHTKQFTPFRDLSVSMYTDTNPDPQGRFSDTSRKNALKIFEGSVNAVIPVKIMKKVLQLSNDGSLLSVDGHQYELHNNVYVVGFGKAVMGMARSVDDLLRPHIVSGILSVPHGCRKTLTAVGKSDLLLEVGSKIMVHEGAKNNLPDEEAHQAAKDILDLVRKLKESDILLVLISGGGSALLPLPQPPITLEESCKVTKILSTHGATINELNIVRKQTEVLKGGGLAQEAKPCKVVSLILSDVIGDKLDIISSGPTVPDPCTPYMCLEIFKRISVQHLIPESVQHTLTRNLSEERPIYRKDNSDVGSTSSRNIEKNFCHVQNVIVGSNIIATHTAEAMASNLGYVTFILSTELDGEARVVGSMFAKLAKYIILCFGYHPSNQGSSEQVSVELDLCTYSCFSKKVLKQVAHLSTQAYNTGKSVCVIAGGETVVSVKGTGSGGRNQEMAVACGMELNEIIPMSLKKKYQVTFLSCGTDGQDGPTVAAGAIVDNDFVKHCETSGLRVSSFLENNDCFNLLNEVNHGASLVKTGITGTNVMDIQLLIVRQIQP